MDQLTSNTPVQEADAPPCGLEIESSSPLRLRGRVTGADGALADDDILISLMAGSVVLGILRPQRSDKRSTTIGFDVPDFGLSVFAAVTGLDRLELLVDAAGKQVARAGIQANSVASNPLGTRHGIGKALRLVDIWLEGARNLNLRFEGSAKGGKSVDVYQCIGAKLIAVASDRPVSGLTSIATLKLVSQFDPVLLVFKGEDRSIDAVDFLPFPSLARGGRHAAERLIASYGADDVSDTAALSSELVAALMERRADVSRCVTAIDIDGAIETGMEPVLDRDLLGWMARSLGIRVNSGKSAPAFIKELLAVPSEAAGLSGHTLHLPADCVPTLASLVRPLPDDAAPQRIVGSYGISDSGRHGRVWSIWEPPLAFDLEPLQFAEAPRLAPALTVRNAGSGRPVSLPWPLAIAFRDAPTRIAHTGPFEIAADFEGSLLRSGPAPTPAKVAILVLARGTSGDASRLLEFITSQQGVQIERVVVCTTSQEEDGQLAKALTRLFPDRHSIVQVPPTAGKLEQIAAAHGQLPSENILVADCDTVLPDPRTVATLARLLDTPEVGSAGCLLRQATDKMTPISAGYSLSEISLRASPQLSFAAIDPAVWRGPSTYPVIANTMAVMLVRSELLASLGTAGSTSMRPESDDLLLGMHVIAEGRVNLCTTVISAFSSVQIRPSQAAISVPYRLDPAELSRMSQSATVVQRVA